MWLPLTLVLLAGVISAESEHGWEVGKEYTYTVRSHTFSNLNEFPSQYAAILIMGNLTVQVKEDSKLTAKLWNGRYAHLHENLTGSWDHVPDEPWEYHDLSLSEKPFDVKLDEGLIDSVTVEKGVPNWEVVLLKSIISQLQVDTKGKRLVDGQEIKIPQVDDPRGWFTVLEDNFVGVCEVRYNFEPLSEDLLDAYAEFVLKPELKGDGQHIDITKTKNYDRYPEMSEQVFGMTRQLKKDFKNSKNLLSKSSTSRIIISGNVNNFVIQSAVSTSEMTITPRFKDVQKSKVLSILSLILDNVNQISDPLPSPKNPEFTGYRVSFRSTPIPLENAPKHPVWPNIIDYGGKFIGKSGEVDGLTAVKELVFQMANELENPNTIASQNTLDKFTYFVHLIRTMSRDQIAEAENSMDISPKKIKWDDKAEAVKQNAWSVFRDAVTQSGTGPALLTIKRWIEDGDLKGTEAAEILSTIPATVRHITDKYIETFFELATNPQVTQTPRLNVTAITAFSELLYQSQLNDRSIYKFYPVHTTGRPSEEQYANIVTKYIPYLAMQLKMAVDDGDSPRIQTYIVALGNIGMYEVLPALEPFLTGREKLTVFQKTLMVASLSNFAAKYPKKALPGLVQIYMNTTESYEVRCMAAYLIPMTNPPLEVLREIVKFSNNEKNKYVKSAVRSTLHELADLKDPEWQPLAENARAAMKLMKNKSYDFMKADQFILNQMNGENLAANTLFNYIGSDDSSIPRTIYLASIFYDGNFKGSPVEFMTMIPNLDSLLDALMPSEKLPLVKMATQKIAEELNIVDDKLVELEGNLMWKTKFLSRFVPFDENIIRDIPNKIAEHMAAKKDGRYQNSNILNLNEMIISDTTDTGLPFVYSLCESTLFKISSFDHFKTGRIKSEFKFVGTHKMQRNIGFVTPFDHRHFVAGVDKYTQVYVPLKVSLEVSAPKKSMQLKIWPLKSNEDNRVIQHIQTPYTSIHNVMDLQPLLKQNNTQRLYVGELWPITMPIPDTMFRIELEGDESAADLLAWQYIKMFTIVPWVEQHSMYSNVSVVMAEYHDEGEPLIFSASYGNLDVEAGTEDANQWTQFISAANLSSEYDSEMRKMQFLQEAAKGMQLAQSWVVDLQLQIPSEEQRWRSNLTFAWSTSNVESKGRFLCHFSLEDFLEDLKVELCEASQLTVTPSYDPIYDEFTNSTPKVQVDVDFRYGENCFNGSGVSIAGLGTRSKELKEDIEETSIVKKCKKQMEQGNKFLRACQKAGEKAMQVDELDFFIKTDSSAIHSATEEGIAGIVTTDYMDRNVVISKPEDNDVTNVKVKVAKNMKFANISVQTPGMKMGGRIGVEDSSEEDESDDDDDYNWLFDDHIPSCVMDLNRAETFDGKEFPLKLSSCWQVLMTTYPRSNPKNPSEKFAMSEDESVSILAREVNGQKEVKVILGRNEILLLPGSQLPEVMVNGQKVEVSRAVSHQMREDDEVVFEIFQRGDNYVSVVSDSFDIDLTYNRERIMIEDAEMFSYSLRGLCGNFDGDLDNDFVSPGNCLLNEPEEFIASYTLTKDQCEGETLQKVKSLQKSACTAVSGR